MPQNLLITNSLVNFPDEENPAYPFQPTAAELDCGMAFVHGLLPTPRVEFIALPGWGWVTKTLHITNPNTGQSDYFDMGMTMRYTMVTIVDCMTRLGFTLAPPPPQAQVPVVLGAPKKADPAQIPAPKAGETPTPFGNEPVPVPASPSPLTSGQKMGLEE